MRFRYQCAADHEPGTEDYAVKPSVKLWWTEGQAIQVICTLCTTGKVKYWPFSQQPFWQVIPKMSQLFPMRADKIFFPNCATVGNLGNIMPHYIQWNVEFYINNNHDLYLCAHPEKAPFSQK